MAKVVEMEQTQEARSSLLLNAWREASEEAAPMEMGAAMIELGQCLTLCAPSGMREDERVNWLTVAHSRIAHIPAKPFWTACQYAMDHCDHPSKIIPTIIKRSKEWADSLLKVERIKRAQYQNANAPKLTRQEIVQDESERSEIAKILAEAKAGLASATEPV